MRDLLQHVLEIVSEPESMYPHFLLVDDLDELHAAGVDHDEVEQSSLFCGLLCKYIKSSEERGTQDEDLAVTAVKVDLACEVILVLGHQLDLQACESRLV